MAAAGGGGPRWRAVTPSQFAHEAAGLSALRERFPEVPPWRAWSNFEFIDGQGKLAECDLLVASPAGVHLVELKAWSGRITGDQQSWQERQGTRVIPRSNPLPLVNSKAKRLRGLLADHVRRNLRDHDPRDLVPFIGAAVFLHSPDLRVDLRDEALTGLYGLDGQRDRTGVPGLVEGLLADAPRYRAPLSEDASHTFALLLDSLGVTPVQKRTVASYLLDPGQHDDGPGWQDFLGRHRVMTDERVRVRLWLPDRGRTPEERQSFRNAAEREYRLLRHLDHPGLERPREFADHDGGPAVVYDHDPRFVPLDAALAVLPGGRLPLASALDILAATAEVLRYAHGRSTSHRALGPRSVRLRPSATGAPEVHVVDWQAGSRQALHESGSATTGPRVSATAHVDRLLSDDDGGYLAPELLMRADAADGVAADVFGLGALAHLLLTGQAPAPTAVALRERLVREKGLDVSGVVDGVPDSVRRYVLHLTAYAVADRTPDVATALGELAHLRDALAEQPEEPAVDPLEAEVGRVLDDRFVVERRLGTGSTAVGLLVHDRAAGGDTRVLKVARDEDKARRLHDEAEVLAGVDDWRVVRLLEPPLQVGPRTALLLEQAGDETLATRLRRGRLSLEELERFGDDLLEVMDVLDRAGVDHRDLKPENIGIRPRARDSQPHLVLFDFSLSRAPRDALSAGTAPYLDPFLGVSGPGLTRRTQWDAAGERFAAAATLLEMASGSTPVYGDGRSDPAAVSDGPTLTTALFDPAVAAGLVPFFRTALDRDASRRFGTWTDMRAAWREALSGARATTPDEADQAAGSADLETPLAAAGLSPRAVSALEKFGATTVGDLLALPGTQLRSSRGVTQATKDEIGRRRRQWRDRLTAETSGEAPEDEVRGLDAVVRRLLEQARALPEPAGAVAEDLLGSDPEREPFAPVELLAGRLDLPEAAVAGALEDLRASWRRSRSLGPLADEVVAVLDAAGRVAGAGTVAASVLQLRGSSLAGVARHRLAAGVVRVVVERELSQPDPRLERALRRTGQALLALAAREDAHAEPAALVAAAAALGRRADSLLERAPVVPPGEVTPALAEVLWPADDRPSEARLLRLAAEASARGAVSGRGELYVQDLPALDAVRATFAAVAADTCLSADQVRARVHARFPAAPPLPADPDLPALLARAGVPLRWSEPDRAFAVAGGTTRTSVRSRTATLAEEQEATARRSAADVRARLQDSLDARSFLVLLCPSRYQRSAAQALRERYEVEVLDLTAALLSAMKAVAADVGADWRTVRAADAAQPGTPDARNLQALVDRAVRQVVADVDATDRPLLLTDAAPLARYGKTDVIARWADQATPRRSARWLLVPQQGGRVPSLDGAALPLLSPTQALRLPATVWQAAAA